MIIFHLHVLCGTNQGGWGDADAGCIGKRGSLCKILVTTPDKKRPLSSPRRRWQDTINKGKKKSKFVPFHAIKAYGGKEYDATYSTLNDGEWST
jgi:hypothetical protein